MKLSLHATIMPKNREGGHSSHHSQQLDSDSAASILYNRLVFDEDVISIFTINLHVRSSLDQIDLYLQA